MDNTWATQESPQLLWFEQTSFIGQQLASITYGMHIIVFFTCSYYILQGKQERGLKNLGWLFYISALFAMGTINLATNIRFNQRAWIDERNYPGGPSAFIMQRISSPVDTLGTSAGIVGDFLADSLLVYRVYVVWHKWYMLVLPIIVLTASTVLSCLLTIQTALPGGSLWSTNTINFSVPYWSISMSLNIILTLLLVARLLWMRRRISQVLGPQYSSTYTSVAAMIIESALPYALVSFVFVVLYGLQNTAENLFIPVLTQVECISPMLVIMRVARGRAVSYQTMSQAILSGTQTMDRSAPDITAEINFAPITFQPGSMASSPTHGKKNITLSTVDSVGTA
ncbi:hypothetical protein CERSUDRAFT_152269 [Gelatoporia subvermispora B]|uniref:Uncharacterized protein n=1 Tax=Ceriporiopsis subvermispora (strain B) TaxID=914234 RepID=M2RL59_CERS8|nr:hypothetical protein CERSUDRAFT_152269 [Gelatoporia subvermispora B]